MNHSNGPRLTLDTGRNEGVGPYRSPPLNQGGTTERESLRPWKLEGGRLFFIRLLKKPSSGVLSCKSLNVQEYASGFLLLAALPEVFLSSLQCSTRLEEG